MHACYDSLRVHLFFYEIIIITMVELYNSPKMRYYHSTILRENESATTR